MIILSQLFSRQLLLLRTCHSLCRNLKVKKAFLLIHVASHSQGGPQFWIQQHAIKTWSQSRPNLPWLTLKKGVSRIEPNSRGFAFSETPGRGTPWRISILWPAMESAHTEAFRREKARTTLRCCGAKPGFPRWKIGLCVAAWATPCDAHWSPLDSHFQKAKGGKIQRQFSQWFFILFLFLPAEFYLEVPKTPFGARKCQR